jgi:tripartite ATP-independent transporter DctM subunit
MTISYVPLAMFGVLFAVLALGIPIAFSLCFISIIFAWSLWGFGGVSLLTTAVWGTMNNFALIAVVLFVYMALILQKTRVVEDIYDACYKWFGGVRGGLAVTTIVVGAILGAVSGVVAAGVIGLGLIGLPQMLKYGYNKKVSLGSVLAGGTLGQLIPPSTTMVVYGAITGVSVGGLFAGGITCGLFLAFLYCVYILTRSFLDKGFCPALPEEDRATFIEKIKSSKGIILPTILIFLVLGSILSGAATPTEAAGVGVAGALMLGVMSRRLTWKMVAESAWETLEITAMVGWIVAGALAFGSVFSGTGGNQLVMTIATSLPGGRWGVFIAANIFVFFLGMFLEPTAMIMLAAPILSPLMTKMGFDPLWWGLVFMMLLQMAYISPPFGFSLFYLKGATPKDIDISDIYAASVPFMGLQILAVILLVFFPEIAVGLSKLLT